jgi:hypothetical protein
MTDVTSLDDRQDPLLGLSTAGIVLLASALGPGLVIWLSCAFGGDPAVGLSLPGSHSQQAQALPAQSGDRVDVVVGANAVTSPSTRPGPALLPQLKDTPGVAEVEDPDVRPDTFLPAQCRHADSAPASS